MRVAHITAPCHAQEFTWRPVQMAIAPWLNTSPGYLEWFQDNAFEYVILDNGAFEKNLLQMDDLYRLAARTQADVIVLPDVVGDGYATVGKALAMVEWVYAAGNTEDTFMFVPQGLTKPGWQRCLRDFLMKAPKDINLVIGLCQVRPYQGNCDYKRHEMLTYLFEKDYPIHLLGIPDLQTFLEYELPWSAHISSVDTSLAYALGMSGKVLDVKSEKVEMFPVEKWEGVTPAYWRDTVEHNRNVLDEWVKGDHV